MATPRENEAADYLKKHKIIELMDYLTSMLFFSRPENPREFLIKQLEQLQQYRQGSLGCPYLFNDSNLDAVFGMLDPIEQAHITYDQYKEALTTLGISHANECPEGADEDRICSDTFKSEAKEGQKKSWADI